MSECVVRMDIDEMPTACGPCKLSCTAICKEWTKVDRKEIGRTKSPNCPILAILPEGYGDLIDRDALIDMVKTEDIALYTCFDSDDAYYSVTDLITILMMQKEIIKAKRKVDASDAVAPNDTPTVPAERSEK